MKFKDGISYEGFWLNDKMSGVGKITKEDMIIEGEFKDGLLNGKGI